MTLLHDGTAGRVEPCTVVSVAYAVSRWGTPTETFVRREAEAVRAMGADVRALSMKRPDPDTTGIPVVALGPMAVLVRAFVTAMRAPRTTARVLGAVVRSSNRRTVGPRLVAAAIGLAWAATPAARADLVHAHFGWVSATATWAAAQVTGCAYSVVLHAFELHSDRCHDAFAAMPLRGAARVFTISARDRDLVRERWGVDAEVLRMGVGDDWLDDAPVPPDARDLDTVVAVGSLVPKKGHDVLIDAMACTTHPWRLVVIGEGPERADLEARIDARGLRDRVRLLGARPEVEVREWLRRATVAALACVVASDGDRDGIPTALMEAMACGTPVVSTRVGGIPELVEGRGLLVDPGDVGGFAVALDALEDGVLRAWLGAAGRAGVEARFRASDSASAVAALALRVAAP